VGRLYNLLYQAHLLSKEYPMYAALMRLIWSGQTPGWDEEQHLIECVESCGSPDRLIVQPNVLTPEAERYLASNQQAMFDYGHWGVPMFSCCEEPFYGQDRINQIQWKIEKSTR